MSDKQLKMIVLDGISIDVTEQGAQAIDKLQRQLAEQSNQAATAVAAATTALAAKDKELGTLTADLANVRAAMVTDETIEALVEIRADTVYKAGTIADIDHKGKSVPDIRRAAVSHILGDDAVKGRSDDYVEAVFDTLGRGAQSADPVRDAVRAGPAMRTNDRDSAYREYLAHLNDAWRGGKGVQ